MINSASLIDKREQRFQNLVLLTIGTVYLLILAGGIVRATGSGMGCPDWPKCFGRWIPPTEATQLPVDYQKIYGAKLKGEVEFNAVKTWIEYANRLLGVLTGFFILGTLISSFVFWQKNKAVVVGSFVAFILVGLNGWLGSRVVATELAQYLITAHLLLAILVVFALLHVFVHSRVDHLRVSRHERQETNGISWLLIGVISLSLIQLLMGTQVRGTLDAVIRQIGYSQRENWVSQLGSIFHIHRSFSIIILLANFWLIYKLWKSQLGGWFKWIPGALMSLIIVEIISGVVMAYFSVPAVLQPVHLVLAVSLIGLQFISALLVRQSAMVVRQVPQLTRTVKT